MKVGDLVTVKCAKTSGIDGIFLVTHHRFNWIKVLGFNGWQRLAEFEVINASR